jgi:hypothetical protein
MKRVTFFFLVSIPLSFGQRFIGQAGFGFGAQTGHIPSSFHPMGTGVSLSGYYCFKKHFAAGLFGGINNYAYRTEQQAYTFNGYTTQTNVQIIGSFASMGPSFLFSPAPFQEQRGFNPYFLLRVLYVDNSVSIHIEDPNDPNGCTPIESNVLYRSKDTWSVEMGAGNYFFPFRGKQNLTIFFECSYQIGGTTEFVDIHQMWDATDHGHQNHALSARFQNRQTGQIHEHRIGTIHSTLLKYFHARIGIGYYFH